MAISSKRKNTAYSINSSKREFQILWINFSLGTHYKCSYYELTTCLEDEENKPSDSSHFSVSCFDFWFSKTNEY